METNYKDFKITTDGFETAPVAGSVAKVNVFQDEKNSLIKFTAGILAITAWRTENGKGEEEMPQALLDLAVRTIKSRIDSGQLKIGTNYSYTLQGKQFIAES